MCCCARRLHQLTRRASQLAAVHAQLSGPLRLLAERSAAAFSNSEGPSAHLLQLSSRDAGAPLRLPPPVAALAAEAVRDGQVQLEVSLDNMRRVSDALRMQHQEVQAALLRLAPGDAARPAWVVMSGKEPPWEAIVRDLGTLANFAIACGAQPSGPAAVAARAMLSEEPPAPARAATAAAASRRAAAAAPPAAEEARMLQFMSGACHKRHLSDGGMLALELATRVSLMLAQLKLASYEAYLHASSLTLGLLIGHLTAVSAALNGHLERVTAAGRVLAAAGAMPPPAAGA